MKFLLFTKPSCRIWIFSLTETHALYYTYTYIHAHGPSRTLLIIIGWDACGMCPGKHKYSAASVAETWLPRRLICSPNIFLCSVQSGVCCVFISMYSRGRRDCELCLFIHQSIQSGLSVRDWGTLSLQTLCELSWAAARILSLLAKPQDKHNPSLLIVVKNMLISMQLLVSTLLKFNSNLHVGQKFVQEIQWKNSVYG